MHRMPIVLFAALLLAAVPARATTWTETRHPDPLADGETCEVQEPMSYGSYIYHWPSKYDQVFWPKVVPSGLWFCQASGFTAFIGDFDGLTDTEKARLREWLAAHRADVGASPSLPERLRLLEGSYALRDKDETFRIELLRVLAYCHDALGDAEKAAGYRSRALLAIGTALKGELEPKLRLEYLFVTAAYAREYSGIATAEQAQANLEAALASTTGEDHQHFVDYLQALLPDLARITPGGHLAPEPETKPSPQKD